MNYLLKNPQIRREWLTRLKFDAILYSCKRNENNILSGDYNLIFLTLARVLFSVGRPLLHLPIGQAKQYKN